MYVQKRHSLIITVHTVHNAKNSPIQGPDYIQPGPEIFIADWLLRHNHAEGKDKAIKGMDVWVDAIQNAMDMPECMSMAEIQHALSQDDHLQQLKNLIIAGWPDTRDDLHAGLRPYWSYRDKLAVIDGVILKGRHIVIPNNLRQQVLNQLHTNHMGIKNNKTTCP